MNTRRVWTLVVTVFGGLMLRAACGAEAGAPNDRERPDEFIVTAKALADLRFRIERAEDEVFARFNEINSNDLFDMHCYERAATGSKIQQRVCLSNAWRKADNAIAEAIVGGLQGTSVIGMDVQSAVSAGYGPHPEQYSANQLRTERLVMKELTQLAYQDPVLHDAMVRVGQAMQALEVVTGSRAEWTLYRDVPAGAEGLPFDAKRLVEVRVGEVAWNHPLTSRTFTIGSVTGRIRDVRVQCGKLNKKLEYKEAVDWTLPDSWGDCSLAVNAKRGTTFALYEF
jgi:hypothetical protein